MQIDRELGDEVTLSGWFSRINFRDGQDQIIFFPYDFRPLFWIHVMLEYLIKLGGLRKTVGPPVTSYRLK